MEKIIKTIFEKGLFRPLERVDLPEAAQVVIRIMTTAETPRDGVRAGETECGEWAGLAGIGDSGQADISTRHDQYLYGDKRDHR